tara:strand:+ start:236 stop:661 length:426 start_codon:yes stop_codon:yes gene_type:complete
MGAFFSFLNKLNEKAQEEILVTSIQTTNPGFVSNNNRKLTIGSVQLFGYFVACFTIVLSAIQLGLSNQSVSFLTLGFTYTLITSSLSTRSIFFMILEIFGCTCIIELLYQLNFENFSWVIVFLLPLITIAHSIFFLTFYLK